LAGAPTVYHRTSAYHEVLGDDIKSPEQSKFRFPNIRIMVPNGDKYWKLLNEMGVQIIIPVANSYYGVRDSYFRIQMDLLFALRLPQKTSSETPAEPFFHTLASCKSTNKNIFCELANQTGPFYPSEDRKVVLALYITA
jgi:hypothetical protein